MRTLTTLLAASLAAVFGLCLAPTASAQVTARVVASCGSPTYVAGTNNYQTVDTTGKVCTSATGGGGGAVTVADGADVTLGAKADAATCATTNTAMACFRQLHADMIAATPAGTNTIGGVTPVASAAGGATPSHAIVAANTTSVAVDASPGTLYSVQLFNNSATIAYLKLYDAAQGSTTCGSGTPKKVLMIPANTSGAGVVINVGGQAGVLFATAITRCVTTGIADNDATAPAASTYLVEADYK